MNPPEPGEVPEGDPWEREWGPLIAGWLRLRCGTLQEFWEARPCEVAAALGIGVYAPKEEAGVRQGRHSGKYPHAQDPVALNKARVAAAQGRGPAPQPVRDSAGVTQLTGAL